MSDQCEHWWGVRHQWGSWVDASKNPIPCALITKPGMRENDEVVAYSMLQYRRCARCNYLEQRVLRSQL